MEQNLIHGFCVIVKKKKKKTIVFCTHFSVWELYCLLLIVGLIDRWEEKQEAENGRGWGKEATEEGKEGEKEGQKISRAFQRKFWEGWVGFVSFSC